jgi:hypothetical protein
MSKEKAGLVKAHCPGKGLDGKPKYITMGAMFKDSETGRFSIKLDSIPVGDSGWSGWCNVFEETEIDRRQAGTAGPKPKSRFIAEDDDIPF